jgi:hypothetical protein
MDQSVVWHVSVHGARCVAVADGLASVTEWVASTPTSVTGSAGATAPGNEATVSSVGDVGAPVEARDLAAS